MRAELFVLVESNTTGTGRDFAESAVGRGLPPVLLSQAAQRYSYVDEIGLVEHEVCGPEFSVEIIDGRAVGPTRKHIGLVTGPAHVELRVAAGRQPVVIEINPRLAGGLIPRLVRYATGRDLVDEVAGMRIMYASDGRG